MAATHRKQNDELESQLLSLLKGTIGGMDKKIDRIDRRTRKLENAVFPNVPQTVQQLPAWYRDPAIIKLLTFVVAGLVLLLVIIASLRGIKLPGIFG